MIKIWHVYLSFAKKVLQHVHGELIMKEEIDVRDLICD